ncbi:MAG TPA: prephenate dehydrogenase/arogenate dehydrogenase family protein [Pyrinomonadaceae bacterium]
MTEIGIIGFGQFGQFMARHLAPLFQVSVCDRDDRRAAAEEIGVRWEGFESVAGKKIVVFAVPLKSFETVLRCAAAFLRQDAICFDVCSVKIEPLRLMREILPATVEIVGTHPLFGPQSGREGIEGMRVALCPARTARTTEIKRFLAEELKLRVFEKTPEEHDREMAHVQALTHFVARALDELHVSDSELATVSYEELMRAARLVSEDSWELFQTIQQGNPYADSKRKAFIEKLIEIEDRVKRF